LLTAPNRDHESGNKKYVTIKINVNTLGEEFQSGRRAIAQRLFDANNKHPGYSHVRFMLETFKVKHKHNEHLCIVYDVLSEPIDVCMRKFPGGRFSAGKLRVLIPSLLQGLDYMHSEARVVHTDLKADNIMMGLGDPDFLDLFVQREHDHPRPRKAPDSHGRIVYTSCGDFGEPPTEAVIRSAKITDIGLAAWGDEKNTKPIQSNVFMAPEVILQAGWSYPADIWNFGVMLWDLFETIGLFDSISTEPDKYRPEQHLGLMIGLLGPPPKKFLDRCAKAKKYFDPDGNFKYPNYIEEDCAFDLCIHRIHGEEKELLIDFAKKMLVWDPEERWTAKQLLEHPFLTKERECYWDTPSLSRASTTSVGSLIPSRAGTPAAAPTSAPNGAHSTLPSLPSRLLELVPSLGSDATEPAPGGLQRQSTNGSLKVPGHDEKAASTTSLSLRPNRMETVEEHNSESNADSVRPKSASHAETTPSKPKRMSVNKSNECSQAMIDAILNRGRPHTPNAHAEAK
jgi:serine/threonine-protein kinase SRPK3